MTKREFLFLSFWSFLFFSLPLFAQEEPCTRRVHAHLLLKDPLSALQEARRALVLFPESPAVQMAFIRALCAKGEEIEALEAWHRAMRTKTIDPHDRTLLEMLAWGVIYKGESSSQLSIRMSALIGAALTRDAKAIPLLVQELRGSSAWLRVVAVRLAAMLADAPLQEEIMRLLKEEKVWYVRLEAIKAIGQLRLHKAKGKLKEIIASPKTILEERATAIISLVNMYDEMELKDLKPLLQSNRAGLRQLGCEIIAHLDLKERGEDLLPLLKDASPEVRISALNALSLLQVKIYQEKPLFFWVREKLEDRSPEVAITAAWAAFLLGEQEGKEKLKMWAQDKNPEMRRLASAALAVTGPAGIPLMLETLKESQDPYVRANLAMGLIGLRKETKLACDELYQIFSSGEKELWMWDNHHNPLFRSLSPSRLRHIEQIPHYPFLVDQFVKLDLLSFLSIMRHPKALAAVKGFLQHREWGVSGAACATLLEEGNEEALALVQQLLEDGDEKIRVQAAFILAIVGSDEKAIKVLQGAYAKMDREMKVHILEALGHIGNKESIPFLLDVMKEPFQALRLVAASALVQCLYH